MFTKEQLAKWRSEGFEFDDFYDEVAVEEKEQEQVDNLNIIGYIWCDNNGNTFRNGALQYDQNTLAAIFTFTEKLKDKICEITVVQKERGNIVSRRSFKITDKNVLIRFDIKDFFKNCESIVNTFSIQIKVDREIYISKGNNTINKNHENLKIHYVILIPEILRGFKWAIALKSQEDWFLNKGNNYPWESSPRLNYFSMSWALKLKRFKEVFDKNFNKWKTADSINSLRNEVAKMLKDGYATLPTSSNKITDFGSSVRDGRLVDHIIKPEELNQSVTMKIPVFDKYYFSSFVYEESKLFPDFDDFYGAIANCSVRFTAVGRLKYINDKKVVATITELGVYIRDAFDFVGKQRLGYWSYNEGKLTNNALSNDSFIAVNNEAYRDYRRDTGMGQDCYRYSELLVYKPNYTFDL